MGVLSRQSNLEPKKGLINMTYQKLTQVGTNAPRYDFLEKVTGEAVYTDDINFGSHLYHARLVRSPYAHALIKLSMSRRRKRFLYKSYCYREGYSITHRNLYG
jgi:hypothetical protein